MQKLFVQNLSLHDTEIKVYFCEGGKTIFFCMCPNVNALIETLCFLLIGKVIIVSSK